MKKLIKFVPKACMTWSLMLFPCCCIYETTKQGVLFNRVFEKLTTLTFRNK